MMKQIISYQELFLSIIGHKDAGKASLARNYSCQVLSRTVGFSDGVGFTGSKLSHLLATLIGTTGPLLIQGFQVMFSLNIKNSEQQDKNCVYL